MAEALLRQALAPAGITVRSAGLGALVDYPAEEHAVTLMRERGIDITNHRAQQLSPELLAAADLVLVMEKAHKRAIEQNEPTMRGKVFRLGEWQDEDIPDPYRKPRETFETALAAIDAGIAAWLPKILPVGAADGRELIATKLRANHSRPTAAPTTANGTNRETQHPPLAYPHRRPHPPGLRNRPRHESPVHGPGRSGAGHGRPRPTHHHGSRLPPRRRTRGRNALTRESARATQRALPHRPGRHSADRRVGPPGAYQPCRRIPRCGEFGPAGRRRRAAVLPLRRHDPGGRQDDRRVAKDPHLGTQCIHPEPAARRTHRCLPQPEGVRGR